MRKVVIITNIPSPYRVDLYYYLQTNIQNINFHIIYTNKTEDNRKWVIDSRKLINTKILKAKVLKIKNRIDVRYVHIPLNIYSTIYEIMPDIVIAMEYNLAAIQGLLWCKIYKKKFIHLTDGTLFSERNIGVIQKFTRKIICSLADASIASSSKAKEKLLYWGVPEKKIFISLLTESLEEYKLLQKDAQPGRILYVGSMVKRKGLDLLINALKWVPEPYELRIVGNGKEEEKEKIQMISHQNKIDHNIVWCGFKEGIELLDEYKKASLFVLPSREDCFGLVLLEAFCARVPIVASKFADGAYDIVDDGVNGFIIDPYDEESFGNSVAKALRSQRMQKNAEDNSLERFEFKNTVEGYLKAIEFVSET